MKKEDYLAAVYQKEPSDAAVRIASEAWDQGQLAKVEELAKEFTGNGYNLVEMIKLTDKVKGQG